MARVPRSEAQSHEMVVVSEDGAFQEDAPLHDALLARALDAGELRSEEAVAELLTLMEEQDMGGDALDAQALRRIYGLEGPARRNLGR